MKNIPKRLFDRLKKIYSERDYADIIKGFETDRITSFRINTLLSDKAEIEDYLTEAKIPFKISGLSELCYIIDKSNEYTLKGSPIFYSGKIYVQGISSQIPALVLDPKKGEMILDVTAAPGSKTTQIAAMIGDQGKIVACEKNQIRFDKLNYNIKLQGVTCVETHKIDALDLGNNFEPNTFDKILLDAPCSAEGRINSGNEKTFGFWSLENIAKKQSLQLELLEHVLPLLKKGGTLVYSTCTLAPEENEEVIDLILQKIPGLTIEGIELNLENTVKGITEFENKKYFNELSESIRINPSIMNEGFYVAKLKKD